MATSLELAADDPALLAAVQRARKLLNRRALAGAAASAVPVPGVGWLVDAALVARLLPLISEQFGLAPQQLEALPGHQREQVEKAVAVVGSVVIGKSVTRELVLKMVKAAGKRLTVRQVSKYVPLAGQAVSAVMGYSAIRYLGEQHIQECVQVCKAAGLRLPAPEPTAAPAVE